MKTLSKSILAISSILLLISLSMSLFSCGKEDNPDSDICVHEWGEWTEKSAATCESKGTDERACPLCEQTERRESAALGHSFDTYASDGNATCSTDGTKTAVCSRNNCTKTSTVADVGSATGVHTGGEANCTNKAVCSACGNEYGDFDGSKHTADTYTYSINLSDAQKHDKKYTCCGAVAESVAHSGGTATCKTRATCSLCSNPYGNVNLTNHTSSEYVYSLNSSDPSKHDKKYTCCGTVAESVAHSFRAYESNGDATCIKNATETSTCDLSCGAVHTREIPDSTIDHIMEFISSTPASCTAAAATNKKCKNCPRTESTVTAPAAGHSLSSYREKAKTLVDGETCVYNVIYVGTCGNCQSDNVETTVTEVRHTYRVAIKAGCEATCVSEGIKIYTCKFNCEGSTYESGYNNSDAHAWIESGNPVDNLQNYICDNLGCEETKAAVVVASSNHTLDKSALSNEIKLNNVSLKLDSATLGKLDSGDVTVSAVALEGTDKDTAFNKLTDAQKELLGTRAIYDFSIQQGNEYLSNFDGGKVTVTVPYILAANEDPDCIVVWFIADDGTVTSIPATYSNNTATFETTHFSNYAVTSISPEDACTVNGHNYVAGETVAATCTSVGYTVNSCTRCNQTSMSDIVYALGHNFTEEPLKVDSTCTLNGKYTYTCTRDGCGETQDVPIPPMHEDSSIFVWECQEQRSANCQEDGYAIYECRICGESKTVVEKRNENWHEYFNIFEFANEDTRYCTAGVNVYNACKIEGCTYKELSYTYNSHLEYKSGSEEDYIAPETVTVYLSDYITLSDYGLNESPIITLTKSPCLCGEVYSRFEFYDPNGMFMESNIWIDGGDAFYEGEYYATVFGMNPALGGFGEFTIKFVANKEKEEDTCHTNYYIDVYIGFNSTDSTYLHKLRYLVGDAYEHDTKTVAELVNPNGKCEDGVILKWVCNDCGLTTGSQKQSINAGEHYYNFVDKIDLTSYSGAVSKHSTSVRIYKCPCSEYVKYDVNGSCYFYDTQRQALPGGSTLEIYTCNRNNCGICYAKHIVTEKDSQCNQTTKTQIYYGYNKEYGTYDGETPLEIYNIETVHREGSFYESTPTEYPCYFTTEGYWYCLDCGVKTTQVTNSYVVNHTKTTVETTDSMGNKIVTTTCENCDYKLIDTYNSDGLRLDSYEMQIFAGLNKKTVTHYVYTIINGISCNTYYEWYAYSLDSDELIEWSQEIILYMFGTEDGCKRITCTVDSSGRNYVISEDYCVYNIHVQKQGSCTQIGYDDYACEFCGKLQWEKPIEPEGHQFYDDMYDGIEDGIYTCYKCGFEYSSGYYDKAVMIEVYPYNVNADTSIVIGYYNRNTTVTDKIDGTVTIELVTYDTDKNEIVNVLEIDYVDDGEGFITISKADIAAAIATSDLSDDETYMVRFNLEMSDGNTYLTIEKSE